MPDIILDGNRIRVTPASAIGKGGEADIYDLGDGRALKLFKTPDHPDLAASPTEQQAALQRIAEHQKKLKRFPRGLPERVVAPGSLATNKTGGIVGYAMPLLKGCTELLRYSDRNFRNTIPSETVRRIFLDLHATVRGIHTASCVIGDFNDLNVLVNGSEAYVIDADSFQFGAFLCRMFTERFVDPLHCRPTGTQLELNAQHTSASDWYAFAVMLMQSLLFVDPYGGIYLPKNTKQRIPHGARPLKRITVFHPEVRYPKPALPYGILPDDLLHFFHQTFERDVRGIFPERLLTDLRWTTCTACGAEHARPACPICKAAAPAAVRETTVCRGRVTATRLFRTKGMVVASAVVNGRPVWLSHEGGVYRREDGNEVSRGPHRPRGRYRLSGKKTLIAHDRTLDIHKPGHGPETVDVDTDAFPIIDANADHVYWTSADALWRDGAFGPERIGDVLSGRTHLWMGPAFGLGLSLAGEYALAFVFDAEAKGINDTVALPRLVGQLIATHAAFTDRLCWWFAATRERGRTVHRAFLIDRDGHLKAASDALAGDGSWLDHIGGACAVGPHLFVPTDDGIVRVEADGHGMRVTHRYPDTEPFVDASTILHVGAGGLVAVHGQSVLVLKIA